jgi:hypothetical protein
MIDACSAIINLGLRTPLSRTNHPVRRHCNRAEYKRGITNHGRDLFRACRKASGDVIRPIWRRLRANAPCLPWRWEAPRRLKRLGVMMLTESRSTVPHASACLLAGPHATHSFGKRHGETGPAAAPARQAVPDIQPLDACRHGDMTVLEEGELADGQGRAGALDAHLKAYEGDAKRIMMRALATTKTCRARRLVPSRNERVGNIFSERAADYVFRMSS